MPEMRDGKAILVGPEGNLVQVDPSAVAGKVESGLYKEAPAELVEKTDAEAKSARDAAAAQAALQTPAAMAGTALRSGIEAAGAPVAWAANKLGLSQNLFEEGLTPEQIAENAAMKAANPIAAGVGEFGGQLALSAATGGFGGTALAGRLGATGLAKAALVGGVEGMGFGAAGATEDPNADAEHVLAAGGFGALLGAGGGALFHAAGEGLRGVFGKTEDVIGDSAAATAKASMERDAAEKAGNPLAEFWDAKTAKASKAPPELVREFGASNVARREEAIHSAAHFDTYVDKTALEMTEESNVMRSSVEDIVSEVRANGMKRENIEKLMGDANADELTNRTAYGVVNDTAKAYQDAIGAFDSEALPPAARRQVRLVGRQMDQTIAALNDAPDAASKYMLANGMKQQLDETTLSLRKAAQNKNMFTPFESQQINEVASKINEVADSVRTTLENSKIWGEKVAIAQREINAIWHEGAIKASNDFGRTFERATGHIDFDTGRMQFEADPARFAQALKSLGTPNGFLAERALSDHLTNMRKMIDKIEERYEMGAAKASQLKKARDSLEKLSTMFAEAKRQATLVNHWRELQSYTSGHGAGIGGAIIGHAAGAAVGGPIGGAIGTAIGYGRSLFTNPASNAATMANQIVAGIAGKARQQTTSSLIDSVGAWVSKGAKAVSESERGRAGATSAAIMLFRGKHKSDDEAMQARTRALLQADPGTLGQHIPNMPDAVALAAGGAASNGIAYLRAQLPSYLQSPSLLRGNQQPVMSRPDLVKFARVWGTVTAPASAAKDLKSGRLMPDQVDALKTVYPSIYDELRTTTLVALGKADDAGHKIPIQTRMQLATLLQLDDAADPALTGQQADRIAGLIAKSQQSQQPQQRPLPTTASKVANSAKTPLESALEA